jgi:hypothetical protein
MRQRPELAGKNVPIRSDDLKSLRLLQGLSSPLVVVAGRRYQYTNAGEYGEVRLRTIAL